MTVGTCTYILPGCIRPKGPYGIVIVVVAAEAAGFMHMLWEPLPTCRQIHTVS